MKIKEAKEMGIEHFKSGGELTPHSCRKADAIFIKEAKNVPDIIKDYHPLVLLQSRTYSKLRGAFNRGFLQEQARSVFVKS